MSFKRAAHGKPWYWEFIVVPDLGLTSVEEAARQVGPAFIYDLTVHSKAVLQARSFCRQLHCTVMHNVLAPYINILIDDSVGLSGWMLSANGVSVGSPGVV